jgi:DNA modification methylase
MDDRYQLHLGDCLEVLKSLLDGSVDAVITDPPYGIASVWKGGRRSGWGKAHGEAAFRNAWDIAPPSKEHIEALLGAACVCVLWGGNYFNLPQSRGWLVWNKPERGFSLAEAELAWTSMDTVIRVFDCRRSDPGREHPTQKPLALMRWCIQQCKLPEGATILDPYMGSGTTGVAALQMGCRFIGCEIEPKYFNIAKRRIEAEARQKTMDFGEASA